MIGLDTNIGIRYFTRDDEEQCQQATEIIQAGEKCFITNIVLCEMVWVLKGEPYKFSKGDILETIEAMLHSPTFEERKYFCCISSITAHERGTR